MSHKLHRRRVAMELVRLQHEVEGLLDALDFCTIDADSRWCREGSSLSQAWQALRDARTYLGEAAEEARTWVSAPGGGDHMSETVQSYDAAIDRVYPIPKDVRVLAQAIYEAFEIKELWPIQDGEGIRATRPYRRWDELSKHEQARYQMAAGRLIAQWAKEEIG